MVVSGHNPPGQPPDRNPVPNPLDKKCPDKYFVWVKCEIPSTFCEKILIAFLKDVFMGLPHYILNLSAFDCIVKPIFRAVPRCELRLNKLVVSIYDFH